MNDEYQMRQFFEQILDEQYIKLAKLNQKNYPECDFNIKPVKNEALAIPAQND